jgi:hypothetical protein
VGVKEGRFRSAVAFRAAWRNEAVSYDFGIGARSALRSSTAPRMMFRSGRLLSPADLSSQKVDRLG